MTAKPKDMWLSIISDEMMRDEMIAFIREIKSFKIDYVSYGTQKRVYLHLKKVPSALRSVIYNWTQYHPIFVIKKPSNISDYDVVDW